MNRDRAQLLQLTPFPELQLGVDVQLTSQQRVAKLVEEADQLIRFFVSSRETVRRPREQAGEPVMSRTLRDSFRIHDSLFTSR